MSTGRDSLARLIGDGRGLESGGVIPAARAAAIHSELPGGVAELMSALLPIAAGLAEPSTSGYRVGAVLEGASGDLLLGANLELPRQPLAFAVHAEQSAIALALSRGERGVRRIALTAPPCGHCRQFLAELTDAEALELLIAGRPATTLGALLPEPFDPAGLGTGARLLDTPPWRLRLIAGGRSGESDDPIAAAALAAAGRSHAPYTRCPSGVAFECANGDPIAGSYIESAAFNPSLTAVLAAFSLLRLAGQRQTEVRRVCLVELQSATIGQRAGTAALVAATMPQATFEHRLAVAATD